MRDTQPVSPAGPGCALGSPVLRCCYWRGADSGEGTWELPDATTHMPARHRHMHRGVGCNPHRATRSAHKSYSQTSNRT